ncbi:MAG: TVP38/TMEM64 family protein [Solirubrobacteraceae bacterium]|nr:TVP38/TMEM64 family protein [Solirubrobacteraceae bacterium]
MSDRARLRSLLLVIGVVFTATAVLALSGLASPDEVEQWVDDHIRDPVRDLGLLGPVLFVVVGSLLTVMLFPGPVLCACGGVIFGTAVGIPTVLVTIVTGAALAFSLSRWWAHDSVERIVVDKARVQALRAWMGRRGFVAVLLARAAPGMPYNLVNYACGLTPVGLGAFVAATALGAAPRTAAYVALGGSFGDLRSPGAIAAVAVLAIMGILGATLLARDLRATVRAPG